MRKLHLSSIVLSIFIVCALVFSGAAHAEERIQDFHSIMHIQANGDVVVEEIIQVKAERTKIKRGIYRDFNLDDSALFYVNSVEHDGLPEPHHLDSTKAGLRLYIGDKNKMIDRGQHRYILRYTMGGIATSEGNNTQWKLEVTGTKWDFPIDEARGRVYFPDGVKVHDIYLLDPDGGRVELNAREDGGYGYQYDKTLSRREGLRMVVLVPQESIAYQGPSFWQSSANSISLALGGAGKIQSGVNGHSLIVAGLGLLAVLIFYLIAWAIVGRDPLKGKIMPRNNLPEDLSPALARCMNIREYDDKVFSVALVELAQRGVIKIEKDGEDYEISSIKEKDRVLTKGQRTVYEQLDLSPSNPTLTTGSYCMELSGASKALKTYLVDDCIGKYFSQNRLIWRIGVFVMVVAMFLGSMIVQANNGEEAMIIGMIAGASILYSMINASKIYDNALKSGGATLRKYKMRKFLTLIGVMISLILSILLAVYANILFLGMVWAYCFLGLVFYWLLPALSPAGREMMTDIEGYRLYLLDEINQARQEGLSGKEQATLLEQHIAYIVALDLDGDWVDDLIKSLIHGMSEPEWDQYTFGGMDFMWDTHYGWHSASFCNHINDSCILNLEGGFGDGGYTGGGGFGGGGGGGGGPSGGGGGFSGGGGGGGW